MTDVSKDTAAKDTKSIAELVAAMRASTSLDEQARIARQLGAMREAGERAAEQRIADERDVLEQELLTELPAGTRLTAVSDLGAERACGTGILIVRALNDEDQRVAVRALHRVSGKSAKSASADLFEFEPEKVLSAILKCAVYPRLDDPERTIKLQKMSTSAFGLLHAGYRAAVSLSSILAQSSAGKSES